MTDASLLHMCSTYVLSRQPLLLSLRRIMNGETMSERHERITLK